MGSDVDIREFIEPYIEKLLSDEKLTSCLFFETALKDLDSRRADLDTLIGEAESTIRMLEPYFSKDKKYLEIGGGVGLTYAYLRHLGYQIISIEPGGLGFANRYSSGWRLLDIFGIDKDGWISMGAEQLPELNQKFDVIFSNFVLEHVNELDLSFKGMVTVLNPNGVMVHRCPNYLIPFEPHYNIPLVPLFPQLTTWFRPSLKHDELWIGLKFLNYFTIRAFFSGQGMKARFEKNQYYWAFSQVLNAPSFAARKKMFVLPAKILKYTGLLYLLKLLPAFLQTPMTFTVQSSKQ